MNFLYVDSCHDQLYVLLYNDGKHYVRKSTGNKKHNSVLLPAIDEVLAEGGLKINQIQNIACVVGPGSFTGIRLGVTTCNGLAFATGANRIAINTFESIAYNITNHILVGIDCRHGNYYVGEFAAGKQVNMFTSDDKANVALESDFVVWDGERDIDCIIACVLDKIQNKNFVEMLSPLYLKKSQAEREADDKNCHKK